jgi:hypothetical protein
MGNDKIDLEKEITMEQKIQKIENDFNDDDYLGMDFFEILERIHKRLTNKESENETDHNI